jgi:hypothetical protein
VPAGDITNIVVMVNLTPIGASVDDLHATNVTDNADPVTGDAQDVALNPVPWDWQGSGALTGTLTSPNSYTLFLGVRGLNPGPFQVSITVFSPTHSETNTGNNTIVVNGTVTP